MRTAVLDRTRRFFGVEDGSVFAGVETVKRQWLGTDLSRNKRAKSLKRKLGTTGQFRRLRGVYGSTSDN